MVCFSLGSNLGDRIGYLKKAMISLQELFGKPDKVSPVYETEGWGVDNHPPYLNAVACFDTQMTVENILENILQIEKQLGRIRIEDSYVPRTIDIDILFYDNLILNEENLIIPHPLLKYRKFVLVPLAGIMGDYVHPVSGISISHLLEICEDQSEVRKTDLTL
jgi:2-amino-4-hydroxy-6-hydroxymethyldihydropteridine diphosphokinase